MGYYNEVVTYCWTEFDTLGAASPIPNTTVSPYGILPSKIPNVSDYHVGDYVQFSLGSTIDPPSVSRFFRNGYTWVPVPEGIPLDGTLLDLFSALYAYDPVQFAHFDPMTNVVSDVGRAAQSLQSASRMFAVPIPDGSDLPFGDLAQLHFEYWGNTDLRAAVFQATATEGTTSIFGMDVSFPMPGTNPFTDPVGFLSAATATLVPQMTPCQKDDAQIQFVLARCPMSGSVVKAPPSRSAGDAPIAVYLVEPPRIELDGFAKQTLAPLFVGEWNTRSSNIRFRITLPASSVLTRIEILRAGLVYYSEIQTLGEFLLPGMHTWTWDGYDNHRVLDTIVLKENTLEARVTTTDTEGRTASSTTSLGTGCEKVRWLDARVDMKKKHVDCTVFQKYSNPSDIDLLSLDGSVGSLLGAFGLPGLPSLPSAASLASALPSPSSLAPSIPGLGSLPDVSSLPGLDEVKTSLTVPKVFDLDPPLFAVFKNQIKMAINAFLSRDKTIRSLTFGHSWALTNFASEGSSQEVDENAKKPNESSAETAKFGQLWAKDNPTAYAALVKEHGVAVANQTAARRYEKDDASKAADAEKGLEEQAEDLAKTNSTKVFTVQTKDDKFVHVDGAPWTVTTSVVERSSDYLHTYLCKPVPQALHEAGITGGGPLPFDALSRSVNLCIVEGLPILDVWDEFNYPYNAVVGAHEVGHSVLRDCSSVWYSFTHKGTSNVLQSKVPSTPTYADRFKGGLPPGAAPSTEYDVMMYYYEQQPSPPIHGEKPFVAVPEYGPDGKQLLDSHLKPAVEVYYPDDYWERMTMIEEDVLGLVSMAKVTFG